MAFPERQFDGRISDEIVAKISNHELLTSHFGSWPTFHDFEVLSIILERAPWDNTATHDLRATFLGFDINKSPTGPERRQATIEIQFSGI